MRTKLLAFVPLLLCAGLPAQLRQAVVDARYVVVAKHVGVRPLGNEFFLHRYETVDTLKGEAPAAFTVAERKKVADMPQPKPGPDRLLCLTDDRGAEDFPERFAPYLVPTGYRGGDPVVDDTPASRSVLQLAHTLLESAEGRSPARTSADLVEIALRGAGPARIEASESLRERPILRDAIPEIMRDALLLSAIGESDDVALKISLASLCAEAGQKGVVEAMCIALQSVDDPRMAQATGRIARHVHGEGAVTVLQPFLQQARGPVRDRVLLAIGATGTEAALQTLLTMRQKDGGSKAVDAALRAHGSPRALEAIEKDGGEPVDADRRR